MPSYIALCNWTDKGIASFRDTTERVDVVADLGRSVKVEIRDIHWCMGQHDLVLVLDAPDDEAVRAFELKLGSGGNVRTVTMRSWSREEMNGILERAG